MIGDRPQGPSVTSRDQGRGWWVVLSGLILLIWGLVALFSPATALVTLALYLGLTLLVTGIMMIVGATANRHTMENWGMVLAMGLIDGIIGGLLLVNPVMTAVAIPFAVGLWAIFRGVLQTVDAFQLRGLADKNWWGWLVGGLLSVVFGWLVLSAPVAGALAITIWAGIAAIVIGALGIGLGLQMRSRRRPPLRAVGPEDRGRRAA